MFLIYLIRKYTVFLQKSNSAVVPCGFSPKNHVLNKSMTLGIGMWTTWNWKTDLLGSEVSFEFHHFVSYINRHIHLYFRTLQGYFEIEILSFSLQLAATVNLNKVCVGDEVYRGGVFIAHTFRYRFRRFMTKV